MKTFKNIEDKFDKILDEVECKYQTEGTVVERLMDVVKEEVKEIVVCAAIKTRSGNVYRGHRHDDAIYAAHKEGFKMQDLSFADQGFVTSFNRYVTREQGRKLQEKAGIKSVDPEGYRGKTLFSEDLY